MEGSPVAQYWSQIEEYLHPQISQLLSGLHGDKTRNIPYSTIESKLMPILAQAFTDGAREVTEDTDLARSVAQKYVKLGLFEELISYGGEIRIDFYHELCFAVNFLYHSSRLPMYARMDGTFLLPVELVRFVIG